MRGVMIEYCNACESTTLAPVIPTDFWFQSRKPDHLPNMKVSMLFELFLNPIMEAIAAIRFGQTDIGSYIEVVV